MSYPSGQPHRHHGTDLWSGHELTLDANMPIALRHHDVLLVRVAKPR